MTKNAYIRMTGAVRRVLSRLPGGAVWLRMPTYLCACAYIAALFYLMILKDMRLLRAVAVPAACFIACTILRPLIGRQRPYDHFSAEPVGGYRPGKGKSMPSRHTASAAAIAFAVCYLSPALPLRAAMLLLCAVIAAIRVLCGQHYVSDVLAALALSGIISMIGYGI